MRKLPIALTMLAVTAGLAISPVTASAKAQAAAACALNLGSVTAGGDQVVQRITATSPPTAGARAVTPNLYADGAARISGSFINEAVPTGTSRRGRVVLGNAVTSSKLVRIGGGWSTFTDYEHSTFNDSATHPRTYEYALRSDGILFRWAVGDIGDWTPYGSAPGFAAVKSMALISKTASYDTFLANTRGGALYTIRIPISAAMKPVVTKVRTGTWQGFEALVAGQCGNYGTVVVGIDKDTKSAYMYTFGHANGLSTSITGHGKVPGTFADPVYFRWAPPVKSDWLFGE
jgi:hypothetical protein